MTDDLLSKVSWTGEKVLQGTPRGIILRFAGLGGVASGPDASDLEWGQSGGLVLYPHHNPWAWMNPETVAFVDEAVDALRQRHGLSDDKPLIATGGSMGGHGALLYAAKSRHGVTRCYANCPVCDLPHHYDERPDLPRTLHSAFRSYGDIATILEHNSPKHIGANMPRIPYLIVHGEKDKAVNKQAHSDALIAILRESSHDITYRELPDMEHCHPMDYATLRATIDFVRDGL